MASILPDLPHDVLSEILTMPGLHGCGAILRLTCSQLAAKIGRSRLKEFAQYIAKNPNIADMRFSRAVFLSNIYHNIYVQLSYENTAVAGEILRTCHEFISAAYHISEYATSKIARPQKHLVDAPQINHTISIVDAMQVAAIRCGFLELLKYYTRQINRHQLYGEYLIIAVQHRHYDILEWGIKRIFEKKWLYRIYDVLTADFPHLNDPSLWDMEVDRLRIIIRNLIARLKIFSR